MKPNVKILVCCHKKDVMATEEPYLPIHAGKALHPELDLGIQGDDTGDNISLKNPNYCELTAMYWAWKNLKGIDIIGLCHYRRYFDFHHQVRWPFSYDIMPTDTFNDLDLTVPQKIIDYVSKGGIIMTKPEIFISSVAQHYCLSHICDDFRALQQVINATQPKEIKHAFYKVMHENCILKPYNMFLMRKDDYDRYCQWLFTVLADLEKEIDISHYNTNQKRVYGYLAERLFNVWTYAYAKDKTKTYPVLFITDIKRPAYMADSHRLAFFINHNLRYRLGRFILHPRGNYIQ